MQKQSNSKDSSETMFVLAVANHLSKDARFVSHKDTQLTILAALQSL
jgi:hypothetical protein